MAQNLLQIPKKNRLLLDEDFVNERITNWFGTQHVKLVLALWLLLAINMMVMELSDVIATAGFVSNIGSDSLPWLWLVMTLLTLVGASGYSVLVDRYSRLNLITWLLGIMGIFYLFLMFLFRAQVPDKITFPLLSIITDQQYYILPLAFWALANDVFSVTEGKRVFPLIASGAVIGSLTGNSLAGLSAKFLEQLSVGAEAIFVLAALLLFVSVIILRIAFFGHYVRARQSKGEDASLMKSMQVGIEYFSKVAMLKMVAIIMFLSGMTLALLEFYFLRSIELNTSGNSLDFQQFLGYFKTAQTIGLLTFQWLITRRLLEKVALKNSFMVLPVFLLGASGIAIGLVGVWGVAIGRFFARMLQRGWDEPTRKSLQGLVPDERRGRVALFMDSVFYNFATIISSLWMALLLWLMRSAMITEVTFQYISLGTALLAALGAIVASFNFNRVYEKSLLDWRFARSKRKSVLDNIEF